MVHDVALRTGHAQNGSAMQPPAPGSAAGSEKGSVVDSPMDDGVSPQDHAHGARRPITASPLAASNASVSSKGSKKRSFNVPPLPPQPAVERLVAAYVDFVGVTAPIIHIPTLGKQLIKIREARDVEQSDIFVVMMVLGKLILAACLTRSSEYHGFVPICGPARRAASLLRGIPRRGDEASRCCV